MDIPWEDVRIFLAVAESGSVSGAARALRVGQPTVSRRLALLEHRLGAALFRRSVRGVALTAEGERLVPAARKMAEWAGEVGRVAESPGHGPRGLVRVTATPHVSHDLLAPFAGWLAEREPGLRLEVLSSIEHLDLARGEADLALRSRAPSQADLILVGSYAFQARVYVSESLAARLPRRPALADLPWIAWAPPFDAVPPNPQLRELVPGYTPAFTSDNYLVHIAAAEAGAGAVALVLPRHRLMRRRALVPLPVDLGPHGRATLHLVCARSALDIPRVRRVADLLVAELERAEREERDDRGAAREPSRRATRRGEARAPRPGRQEPFR
jgi:DNA-binding transcriptional LysR family regulator